MNVGDRWSNVTSHLGPVYFRKRWWPAAFSYWHRRPDHQPEDRISARSPKSGCQPSSLGRPSCPPKIGSHTNAHTNTAYTRAMWLECCNTPNRKCHRRGGKSVPGNETEESCRRRTRTHFGGRLSYCVVYATRQGTGFSCAPPKSTFFPALSLRRPRMPTTIKSLRRVMESVPGSFNELFA